MKIAATKCSKKLLTVQLCRGGKKKFYFSKIDFFFLLLKFIKVNNSRVIAPGQGCAKKKKKSDRITCICCPSATVVCSFCMNYALYSTCFLFFSFALEFRPAVNKLLSKPTLLHVTITMQGF